MCPRFNFTLLQQTMKNVIKKQSFMIFGAHLVGILVVFLQNIRVLLFFFRSSMASTRDTASNPENCYKVLRRTHKRNSIQSVSMGYEVYFSDIEGNAHYLKNIQQVSYRL